MTIILKAHQLIQLLDGIIELSEAGDVTDEQFLNSNVSLKALVDKDGNMQFNAWLTNDPTASFKLDPELPQKIRDELDQFGSDIRANIQDISLKVESIEDELEVVRGAWRDCVEQSDAQVSFKTDYYQDPVISFSGIENVVMSECADPEALTFTLTAADPNQYSFNFSEKQ